MTTESQQQENFEQAIHDIFIKPIRNMAIIDDQFPSYLELLSEKKRGAMNAPTISSSSTDDDSYFEGESVGNNNCSDAAQKTVSVLTKLLESCSNQYIIYTDNRTNIDLQIARCSDIFILDYMLTADRNPSHCINILFKFLDRDKPIFGIIYTQEDISEVVINVACALSGKNDAAPEESLEYIPEDTCRTMLSQYFSNYNKEVHNNITRLINKRISENFPSSTCTQYYNPTMYCVSDHFCLTGENFHILIVNKNDIEIDSKEKLQKIVTAALTTKRPTPIKMIAHNCISELSSKAPSVIQKAFGDAEERAGLLYHAMSQEYPTYHGEDRRYELICHDIVGRIMEDLTQPVSFGIQHSVKSVINSLDTTDKSLNEYKIMENVTSNDMKVMVKLNSKLCSKNHDLDHITTGTIFTFNGGYYVCTSPSCDLVPERECGKSCQRGKLKKANYFFASKITLLCKDDEIELALTKATQGRHIFVNTPSGAQVFSFCGDNNFPKPFTFYVTKSGFVGADKQFYLEFTVSDNKGSKLIQKKATATVISQLRYLYASNLLQKFGAYNFRIGVDFRSHP